MTNILINIDKNPSITLSRIDGFLCIIVPKFHILKEILPYEAWANASRFLFCFCITVDAAVNAVFSIGKFKDMVDILLG